jgi:hypothetical protein
MVGGNQQFVREQEYQASGLRPVGILSKLECRNVWPSPVPQQALLDDTSRLAAARMRESGYVISVRETSVEHNIEHDFFWPHHPERCWRQSFDAHPRRIAKGKARLHSKSLS